MTVAGCTSLNCPAVDFGVLSVRRHGVEEGRREGGVLGTFFRGVDAAGASGGLDMNVEEPHLRWGGGQVGWCQVAVG